MKAIVLKIWLVFMYLALTGLLAGSVSEYYFESFSGGFTEITGGTTHGSNTNDNENFLAVPLGFNFNFNGVTYSEVSIQTNGFLAMGSSVVTSNVAISSPTGTNNIVAALNRDIKSRDTGSLMSLSSGIAPNRVFTVQWLHYRRVPTTAANDDLSFQIMLFESSNAIEVVYGAFTAVTVTTAAATQVGLRGDSNADFNNRATTTDWSSTNAGTANSSSCILSSTVYPATNLSFKWTPPIISNVPLNATNPIPADNATGVAVTALLGWSHGGGSVTGYKVYLGTNNPPDNIVDGLVQYTTSYNPGTLQYNTVFYWQIVPYNTIGDAVNCPIWSFTTVLPPPVISGSVSWQYNQLPVQNIPVKLYNSAGTGLLQTQLTNELGEYSFIVSNNTYHLKIDSQSLPVNSGSVEIDAIDSLVTVSSDTILNLELSVSLPFFNTSDCSYVGSLEGREYWRSNWTDYWEYLSDAFNNRGGHHVTISSAAESNLINQYILQNGGDFHLGFRYDGSSWYWVDGSPVGFTNWAPGQPDGNSAVAHAYNDNNGHVYWDDVYYWDLSLSGIMESNGLVTPLAPQSITGLNIQQQRDFTVNLSWTNPSEVICGLSLLNGFDIVIKRDGVVVASLTNCTAGAALNWQDFVLTGRHTYDVLAVNEYGESIPVSQSVSYGNQVQGVARLDNTSDHSGIKVKFIADPSTPAAVSDSTYTNINGFYSINLIIGRYTVVFSKTGYLDASYYNYMHSGVGVIPNQTLEYVGQVMYLSGSLSGTLTADYAYIVNSQIWVDSGNTLSLNPGVKFYFKDGIGFNVDGTLIAIGTTLSPIVFSAVGNEKRGDLWLSNNNIILERCEFTKASYGVRINANASVSYSKIYNVNNAISLHGYIPDCVFEFNEIFSCSDNIILSYCNGARVQYNEIYDNHITGNILLNDMSCSMQFNNNYVYNNSSSGRIIVSEFSSILTVKKNSFINNSTTSWFYYPCIHAWPGYMYVYFDENIVINTQCSDFIQIINSEGGGGSFSDNLIYHNQGSVNINGNNYVIIGNTIIGNTGEGLSVSGDVIIENNIIAYNGGFELVYNSSLPRVKYNILYDITGSPVNNIGGLPFLLDLQAANANGTPCDSYYNISTDPLLYDVANNNFNLLPTSPCINAGDPASPLDPDGTIADLGAYYYDLNASSHAQIAIPLSLYNFQSIAVGDTLIWNCPVRNIGTDPLIISSIQLNNPVFYLETETRSIIPFSITIQPNQTGYIPIGFTPAAVADYADTLRINSNALMNPQVSIRIFGAGTTSSSITLAMPQNNVVNVLSDLQLPLSVSDTTPYNLLSYNMSLSYDPAIFEFISLETVGTLCADWFTAVNSVSPGVLHIGASGVNPLAGSGNLFKLNFHTLSGILDGTESFININQVTFNEGGISLQGCFAAVTIRNIIYGDVDDNLAIQAYDAALTLQYSVMMDPLPVIDPRPWLDWRKLRADVSGDGNIFAYDASLILQRVVGLITVFPVEQTRPEPPLATVDISFYNNQLIVSSPDFSSLYGLNLSALLPEGLSLGQPQLSEAFSEAVWNQYTDYGVWNFALACIIPQTGSGTICTIPVSANANTELSFSIVANETESQQSVSILPLAVPDPPEIAVNFLAPNSPNPFNPSTVISYGVKEPARVELGIYNLKGQKVKSLVNAEQSSGAYRVVWNGNDDHDSPVGSGIYFCRIKIGNSWSKTQKMMLMK